jgi:acetyl-CoA carboxylase biotin carboxyl carrier protein
VTDETAGRALARSDVEPADGLETMIDEVLPALIARLRASRLGELEVRSGDWRIRLRRDPAAPPRAVVPTRPSPAGGDETESDVCVARSPAVGYFTPSSDLVVGHSVQAGDVLGVVDVLGIAQEVVAPGDGIIASVLADDGQAVEYAQALAEIDTLEPTAGDAEGIA